MKELKILHLYSDLLDLYGDYTNVTAVRRAAAQLGYESAVTEVQLGEPIDPTGYDFIYICLLYTSPDLPGQRERHRLQWSPGCPGWQPAPR